MRFQQIRFAIDHRFFVAATTYGWMAVATALAVLPAESANADAALFGTKKCASCHSIMNLKIEKQVNPQTGKKSKGPDLSGVGKEMDAAKIELWLKKELTKASVYDAQKQVQHKKKWAGTPEDLTKIANFLAAQKTPVQVADDGADDAE